MGARTAPIDTDAPPRIPQLPGVVGTRERQDGVGEGAGRQTGQSQGDRSSAWIGDIRVSSCVYAATEVQIHCLRRHPPVDLPPDLLTKSSASEGTSGEC